MLKKKKCVLGTISMLLVCMLFSACGEKTEKAVSMWDSATYKTDTVLGEGAKTLLLEVTAEEKTVLFTVKTEKETVGEALKEQNLIAGEEGAYGLYVKVVNGMTADYDTTKTYWAFSKNGEYMLEGVDSTAFSDGERFEFVCTA